MGQLVVIGNTGPGRRVALPAIIAEAGKQGAKDRFLEFFTVNIRNPNTRDAYHRTAVEFLDWCEEQGISGLDDVRPFHVAAYIEQLGRQLSAPSVKQHLACIRMLFDWLVLLRYKPP
jgi:site-specific recombinase XerD